MGDDRFLPEEVLVVQHEATQDYIASNFAADVEFMSQSFGSDQGLGELEPQPADLLLGDSGVLDIDLGGQRVRVQHLGFAQTEGDLMVHVPDADVLFVGNPILGEGPSIPWLLDGRRAGAAATLATIKDTYPAETTIVPGMAC